MDRYEVALTMNRIFGAYAWVFWGTIVLQRLTDPAAVVPARARQSAALFAISLGVLVGMWLERFMLIVTSSVSRLHALELGHVLSDLLGSRFSGRLGRTVLVLYLLFVRLAPVVSMFELRKLVHKRTAHSSPREAKPA